MKTASKVLSIIAIIFSVIFGLGMILGQSGIRTLLYEAYHNGMEFTVNGRPGTDEEFKLFVDVFCIVFNVLGVVALISIVFHILNIVFLTKDNLSAILVMGILLVVFGNLIIGIIDIIYYVTETNNRKTNSKTNLDTF